MIFTLAVCPASITGGNVVDEAASLAQTHRGSNHVSASY